MTLPSIFQLSEIAAKTIRRFPLVILAAYSFTILSVVNNHKENEVIGGIVIASLFVFVLSLAVDVFMESKKIKAPYKFFVRLLVLAASGALYYYFFRHYMEWRVSGIQRFFLIEVASLALLFFAPFVVRDRANAFWQYAVGLIVRGVLAFVFFGLFFVGIFLLIQSINYLFDAGISDVYYFDVWVVLMGIFASVFFLAGMPGNFARLEQSTAYPKFLRVLTEYFLVPLTFLYLLVLYGYAGKVLFTWQWPSSEVSNWIVGFLSVGLIVYFFAYLAKGKFLHYVEFFKKWYFLLILPLIVVLGLAVGMRIKDYGITEGRYFVAAFGVWMVVMAAYYLFTKTKNLKFIPISFFVIVLLSIYGPQSAFDLSEQSQLGRLEILLLNNDMLVNGKVVKVDEGKVAQEDAQEISSIVWYLVEYRGAASLQQWFYEDLSQAEGEIYTYWDAGTYVLQLMGLEDVPYGPYDINVNDGLYKIFLMKSDCSPKGLEYVVCSTDTGGYRYFVNLGVNGEEGVLPTKFRAGEKEYFVGVSADQLLSLTTATGEVIFSVNLKDFVKYLGEAFPGQQDIPVDTMTMAFKGGMLRISQIDFYNDDLNVVVLEIMMN